MDRAGLVSLLTLLWNVLEQDWHCTAHGEGGGAGSWEHQYTVFDRHGPRCAHMPPKPTLPC